jgi:hypothetical protein
VVFRNHNTLHLNKDSLLCPLRVSILWLRGFGECIPVSVAGNPLSKYSLPEYPATHYVHALGRASFVEIDRASPFDPPPVAFSVFRGQ